MSRSEEKNEAARRALKPLGEGERPLVVTIGAILSTLICASIVVGWILGLEVDGRKPPFLQVLAPSVLTGVMAYGMWRARYWAVLGFQTVLLLLMLATAMGLVIANSALQVIGNLLVLSVSGTLFWFMVKGMARIQMPERRPSDERDPPQD